MRFKAFYLLILSLIFAFSSALALDPPTSTQNNSQKQDGEIIAWLITVDKNEVAVSKAVLHRKVNDAVKEYANFLDKQHSQNLRDVLKLSANIKEKPVQTPDIEEMKKQAHDKMDTLKSLNDHEFQIAFVDAMVTGHEGAIKKINQYIETVSNPKLKAFLESTKTHLEVHLEKAKALQEKFKSNS